MTPATLLAIDEAAWNARVPKVVFVDDDGVYRFIVPRRSRVVDVGAVDGNLQFFLDRSADHRALYGYLTA